MNDGSIASVAALLPQDGAGGTRWPRLLDASMEGQQATLRLLVPAELYWFGGHFDGRPVLPGVVQTHWAATLAAHLFAPEGRFKGIDGLKFHQLITPDTELGLRLSADRNTETGTSILFVFHSGGEDAAAKISQGRLQYQ